MQISISNKREVILFKESHPKYTQDEIASHFNKEWGKVHSIITVCDILCDKSKYSDTPKYCDKLVLKCAKKYNKLEQALFLWISDV